MESSYRSLYKNQDILLHTQMVQKRLTQEKDHVLILLPAVRYAAVLESRPRRTLDIFQEAVLRCLRAGADSLEAVAGSLALRIDLVRRIAQDMEGLEMTRNGRLTEQGERALRGLSEEQVFSQCDLYYDSLRSCLWDAACESGDLSVVNPSSDMSGKSRSRFEILNFGSVGAPREKRAYYVHLPDSVSKSWRVPEKDVFTAVDRLEAVKRSFRRRNQFRWDWENEADPETADVQAVEIIGSGIPCYIGTLICPVKDGWTVRHPFDGGEYSELRQFLDDLKDCPGYEDLKKNIHNVWDGGSPSVNGIIWERSGEKARALFRNAPGDTRLLELLSNALSSWRDLKNMTNASAEKYKSRLKDYVVRCYESVERLLKTAAETAQEEISAVCPTYDLSRFLTNQTALNSVILAGKARSAGFREKEERPFQRFFSNVPGTYMLGMGRREMTVLLARNLLLMQDAQQHPFRRLLREGRADFIDRVIQLKPLRDDAMHAYDLPFSFAEVEDFLPELLRWLLCFYPNARLKRDALDHMAEAEEPAADKPKPLSSPEQRLDEIVGAVLHRFPDIRDLAVHLENLLRGNSPDVFQTVCAIYECCCERYMERSPDCLAQLRQGCGREHLDFCFRRLADKGFTTQSEQLNRWANSVHLNAVKKAAKLGVRKAKPSIKLFLALYAAAVSDAPEVTRIAAERPMLIEQAAESIRQRGHSSADVDPDVEKRRKAVEDLYKNLRTVLNVFSPGI